MSVRKISIPKGQSIYELQNKNSPHWGVGIMFSNGTSLYKEIPNDHNNKQLHEKHVLDLFIRSYVAQRWDNDRAHYTITGNDGIDGQRHDFCVAIPELENPIAIEITKLSDSNEVHLAHSIRDKVSKIIKRTGREFFVYADQTTSPRHLENAVHQALELPAIEAPYPDEGDEAMRRFIDSLSNEPMPYVRLVSNGVTQIHTKSVQYQSLREAVQQAVTAKEKKNYSPYRQQDMILVIDDKSLRYSREYIDSCAALLNYYFMGSTFKEIYIISRKTSTSGKKKTKQEVMFTPVKSSWHPVVFENIIFVARKIREGNSLPFNF